ncbi:unnamed protein product, partial [Boreogadus saida]
MVTFSVVPSPFQGFLVSASDARVGVTSLWIISSSCSSEYIDMKALIGLLLLVFGHGVSSGFLVSASDARVGVTSLWIISSSCSSEYIDMKALIGLLLLVFGHGVSS